MSKFDTTKFTSVSGLAHELATVAIRIQDREDRIDTLQAENAEDEHRITQLDRWMLANFEANPNVKSLKTHVDYRDAILVPDNGLVLVYVPDSSYSMTFVPYPIEPDGTEPEFDDDDAPLKMHPMGATNGHRLTLSEPCS